MAWIFLGGQREGATACKGSNNTPHTIIRSKQGWEEPRVQNVHTHQQKSLVFLTYPPLSPSSLRSFTCPSTLFITTTINHMINARRANDRNRLWNGALVRGMAQEVLRRSARHPFCGSPLLKERGRGRERETYLHYLLADRLRKIEKSARYLLGKKSIVIRDMATTIVDTINGATEIPKAVSSYSQ